VFSSWILLLFLLAASLRNERWRNRSSFFVPVSSLSLLLSIFVSCRCMRREILLSLSLSHTHTPGGVRFPYCFPLDGRSPVSHPTCEVPYPPRRSGEYRKGMIPARPLYQGGCGSVWDPEPSKERVGDWGGPATIPKPSPQCGGTSHGAPVAGRKFATKFC
jgi:hypothetical protein